MVITEADAALAGGWVGNAAQRSHPVQLRRTNVARLPAAAPRRRRPRLGEVRKSLRNVFRRLGERRRVL
eukprot:gene13486-5589_t